MPTAWERFVTVVGQFLAPLMDGGVGNAQLTSYLGNRLSAGLSELMLTRFCGDPKVGI